MLKLSFVAGMWHELLQSIDSYNIQKSTGQYINGMVKTGRLPTSVSGSEKPLYKDSKKKKSEESALRRRLSVGSGDRSER